MYIQICDDRNGPCFEDDGILWSFKSEWGCVLDPMGVNSTGAGGGNLPHQTLPSNEGLLIDQVKLIRANQIQSIDLQ